MLLVLGISVPAKGQTFERYEFLFDFGPFCG
jgi:hypothetical protein